MNIFGNRMKELRKSMNLRQIDLAETLDISQTAIANYENNSRFPNEIILIKLADFFDVSLDYLLGRTHINLNDNETSIDYTNIKFSEKNISLKSIVKQYIHALLMGKKEVALNLILSAIKQGVPVEDIYVNIIEKSFEKIGYLWECNDIHVGQEHYFSETSILIMSQLYPYIVNRKKNNKKAVSLVVNGEFHCIGVKMVNDLLEKDGWQTYYLGINTPSESIIKTLEFYKPDIIAISATMHFNINSVDTLIKTIRSYDSCKDIKILVGGNLFNKNISLWKEVHADGYARNAIEAVEAANKLTSI